MAIISITYILAAVIIALSNSSIISDSSRNEEKQLGVPGQLLVDLGTQWTSLRRNTTAREISEEKEGSLSVSVDPTSVSTLEISEEKEGSLSVSVDPTSVVRLGFHAITATGFCFSAFLGTLRLLVPLIVSRQALCTIINFFSDYLCGRYFRKSYNRAERLYIKYYEAPAVLRAIARTCSQIAVLHILSGVMAYLVGISHQPCHSEGRGLAFFCGSLWLFSVIGIGHAFASYIANWGGPIRIQADIAPIKRRQHYRRWILQPWHILQWLQNTPDQLKLLVTNNGMPNNKLFKIPLLFPATWWPLRIIEILAMAKVLSTEPCNYSALYKKDTEYWIVISRLMKQFLVQIALADEWYRVLIGERRPFLGLCVVIFHLIALMTCFITSTYINRAATAFMIPSIIAVIISGWMNVVIILETRMDSKQAKNRFFWKPRWIQNRRKVKEIISTPMKDYL